MWKTKSTAVITEDSPDFFVQVLRVKLEAEICPTKIAGLQNGEYCYWSKETIYFPNLFSGRAASRYPKAFPQLCSRKYSEN